MNDLNKKQNTMPTIAPGIDNDEELEQKPSKKEMEQGEYTEVTALVNNEVEE